MNTEKAKRYSEGLATMDEHIEMLSAYSKSIQYKIDGVLSGHLPEEETLDECSKLKGKIHIYGKKVEGDILYILKHV